MKEPSTFHCYWVVNDGKNFGDARNDCQSGGGHLVTLNDSQENAFVTNLVSEVVWIGATDGKGDSDSGLGQYGWVTGEPWAFTNWAPGEPNVANVDCGFFARCYEHCATLKPDSFWNDRPCPDDNRFVCERDPAGY